MEIYIQQCQTNSANPLMEPTLDSKTVQASTEQNQEFNLIRSFLLLRFLDLLYYILHKSIFKFEIV